MRIGVFDSGIGGKAVTNKLTEAFPEFDIITVNDSKNVPYGTKPAQQIIDLTHSAIQPLIENKCSIIVLACNTATAIAIESLRSTYKNTQFVGLEPMVKTAATLTKSGIITVCATPATLESQRYKKLKGRYAHNITILEPDCSEWAGMIERKAVDKIKIAHTIETSLIKGSDVIVLGCTHYHWIEELISNLVNNKTVKILQPTAAVIRRVAELSNQSPAKAFTDCINC